jgi:hypothetical protein
MSSCGQSGFVSSQSSGDWWMGLNHPIIEKNCNRRLSGRYLPFATSAFRGIPSTTSSTSHGCVSKTTRQNLLQMSPTAPHSQQWHPFPHSFRRWEDEPWNISDRIAHIEQMVPEYCLQCLYQHRVDCHGKL